MKGKILTTVFVFSMLRLTAQSEVKSNIDTISNGSKKWNYGISLMLSTTPKITGKDVISGETTLGKGGGVWLTHRISKHWRIGGALRYLYASRIFSIVSYDPKNPDNKEVRKYKNYYGNVSIPVFLQYNLSVRNKFQPYAGIGVACTYGKDGIDQYAYFQGNQTNIPMLTSALMSGFYFPLSIDLGTRYYLSRNTSVFLSVGVESLFINRKINSFDLQQGHTDVYSNFTFISFNTGLLF